jgi:hypothetical protein
MKTELNDMDTANFIVSEAPEYYLSGTASALMIKKSFWYIRESGAYSNLLISN